VGDLTISLPKHTTGESPIALRLGSAMCSTGMKGTLAVDKTEKVGITLPKSILQRIDKVRGDIPRSTYIRRAVEVYLKQAKGR
jgi:hypothetical protein